MSTFSDQIWDAYNAKKITAEQVRELLTAVKKPQSEPTVHARSMTTSKSRKQVKSENSRKRYSAAEIAQIEKGIANGYTHRAIAKALGRSAQAINHRAQVMKSQNQSVKSIGGGQTGMQL